MSLHPAPENLDPRSSLHAPSGDTFETSQLAHPPLNQSEVLLLNHAPPRAPFPVLERETDVTSALLAMMEQIMDENDPHQVRSRLLENIAHNDDQLSRLYRPHLTRALFHFQHLSSKDLKADRANNRTIEHLKIVDDLLVPRMVNEMHLAERLGWIKLMNIQLSLLSVTSDWTDSHTKHLTLVASILRRVLLEPNSTLCIDKDRYSKLITSSGWFLIGRFDELLKEHDIPENITCLEKIASLAGALRHPELLPVLKECFLQDQCPLRGSQSG